MVTGSPGERIAAYRRRRGLSQAALAGLVGRSESWLSQVERGLRSADRLSVLVDMARVLHVDVDALTGGTSRPSGQDVAFPVDLGAVRAHFVRYDHLVRKDARPVAATALNAEAGRLHHLYQAAKYRDVVALLPGLLADADGTRRVGDKADSRTALSGYFASYLVAAKLLTKMGVEDLALMAADRCASAALDIDCAPERALAAYQVACALLRSGRRDDAEHLAITAAESLRSPAGASAPDLASAVGSLWLIAAVIAARRLDRLEAGRRLAVAETLANAIGHDANYGWTAFGPTNVAIHRVSVGAEIGDASGALDAASTLDLGSLPTGLKSRRAQVLLDLAWAQSLRKRDAEAVLHLLDAEKVAPEAVRYNVVVRHILRDMLARTRRQNGKALHELAVRAGVID